ncbi:Not3-domain-containing protein [Neoconidiobolus thromboides FSU 785]|nr:Not3-domain-containing protein [Neoconidiobolus thromboides FSU 785]
MASRKVQAEIDKVAKKINEGISEFNEIFVKMESAQNANMAHKYEAMLKTEIKKLQRHRDSMKQFASSPDVKDKTFVTDQRRLVETYMEKFKAIEKEMKTKTFSKEGLMQSEKVDPLEKEKNLTKGWIREVLDELQIQIDLKESEAENLGINKKKKDLNKLKKFDEIKNKVERHKHHISKLELILRMLDNEHLSPEQINMVRDDVEAYVKQDEYDDYEEPEWMYDDLNIDDENLFDVSKTLEEQALYLETNDEDKIFLEPEKKVKPSRLLAKSEDKTSTIKENPASKVVVGKSVYHKPEEVVEVKKSTIPTKEVKEVKEVKKEPETIVIAKRGKELVTKSVDEVLEKPLSMAQIIAGSLADSKATTVQSKATQSPIVPTQLSAGTFSNALSPQDNYNRNTVEPAKPIQEEVKPIEIIERKEVQPNTNDVQAQVKQQNTPTRMEPAKTVEPRIGLTNKAENQGLSGKNSRLETPAAKINFPLYLDDLSKIFHEARDRAKHFVEHLSKVQSDIPLSGRPAQIAATAHHYYEQMLEVGMRHKIVEADLDP